MANFKQLTSRQATSGPPRFGVAPWSGSPLAPPTDPAGMQIIMLKATYAFVAPYVDQGGTSGGVTMTKGQATTGFRLDQSDSDFGTEITANTMVIATSLGQTGDIEKFVLAWGADPTTTAIVGPPAGRKKGLAAEQIVVHRTLAVMEADRAGNLRAFWFRDVTRSGDSAFAIAPGALHLLPITLNAEADLSLAGHEFGWIVEDDGFGGIANP